MKRLASVSMAMAVICCGCSDSVHSVTNTGDVKLYSVYVRSGGHEFGHGALSPGDTAGYIGSMKIGESRPPKVSWKTSKTGEVIIREVPLDRKPRRGEEVVFELDGESVTVTIREGP